MLLRLLHIVVLVGLVLAAADVYKIKYESTLQAEKVAKLGGEIREQRNAIASLRAQWARLATPERIQGLAQRHLQLQPVKAAQFGDFNALPERPPQIVPPAARVMRRKSRG